MFNVVEVLTMHSFSAISQRRGDSYGIVIDAGSSGTRLRVFRWQPVPKALPQMREVRPAATGEADPLRRRPGLSGFARHPEEAAQQVLSLVAEARRLVPFQKQPQTPLFLKATAGLRLLQSSGADAIMGAVREALTSRSECPFHFAGARIISGEEEALFGWLSINHLLGVLEGPPEMR